jgi:hypothetical protein
MSELLFENPLIICLSGGAFVVVALITWIQGGFRQALYVAIGLALLTIVLFEVNINVETDRESIERVLHDVASDLEHNEYDEIYSVIHPEAVEGIRRAKSELPNYRFTVARVTGIKEIKVDRTKNPPSATAEFHVAVSLTTQGNEINGIRRFVRVTFLQRDGRWLVHDYEHFDVAAGFQADPI